MHKPVLVDSVLSCLNLRPGCVVVDATVGGGGHAEAILKAIGPNGTLIGLDQDEKALERTQDRLRQVEGRVFLRHENFRHLDQVLSSLHFKSVHAVLLDVGVSSEQLEDPGRGFSFQSDAPMDMRMDERIRRSARDLVRDLSDRDLQSIFRQFGEERRARRIAQAIVRERARKPIETTRALRELIEKLTPLRYRFSRIHPATRVFQALRIVVNDELGALEEALPKAVGALEKEGRLAVITFHSLEDRIVKRFFVQKKTEGVGKIITKKPIRPTEEEVEENPRARSAKLRVIERCGV
ncbi:MAG: 16S rRNA (cytosine(1402)-N(4))-methyltransferase RsmH [Candidatus Omnitrophica bacterium]|nr:16S rRNA (cytosine(1402)-N(4))-methyltransferase RsmH [Candidatus Omnitrophota bacterium]